MGVYQPPELRVLQTEVVVVEVVVTPVALEINWVAEPAAQVSLLFHTHLLILT
jgi:hypothetical protein